MLRSCSNTLIPVLVIPIVRGAIGLWYALALRINELRGCRQWSKAPRDVCPSGSIKGKPIPTPVLTIGQGVLWGWLLALGAIFWASMIGLDHLYLPFISHNSTIPEDIVVPIEEALAPNYLSKYVYQLLTLSAVFGIAFYINRRFFKTNETNITNDKQITVNEEQEMGTADESMAGEEQSNKNALEINNNRQGLGDEYVEQLEKDIQDSFIIPPTVDVRELQARLKEFENNLALLKQKGERLVNHTEMQKKRWEELNAGDQ